VAVVGVAAEVEEEAVDLPPGTGAATTDQD